MGSQDVFPLYSERDVLEFEPGRPPLEDFSRMPEVVKTNVH